MVDSRPKDTTVAQIRPLAFKARDEAEREVSVVCKEEIPSGDVVIEREVVANVSNSSPVMAGDRFNPLSPGCSCTAAAPQTSLPLR
jgi:hypothetical protein